MPLHDHARGEQAIFRMLACACSHDLQTQLLPPALSVATGGNEGGSACGAPSGATCAPTSSGELGVAFDGFEAADDVGGTWHPQRTYAGLRLHTLSLPLMPWDGRILLHFSKTKSLCMKTPSG